MKAFFIAHGEDYRGESYMGHPIVDLTQYDVVVTSAGARVAVPESDAQLGYRTLGACNGTLVAGHPSAFSTAHRTHVLPYLLRDSVGELVPVPGTNAFYFDFRISYGAHAHATWIGDNYPVDIYVDDFTEFLPLWKQLAMPVETRAGQAASWPGWRSLFLERLRMERSDSVIVGNTAGFVDPRFSGICIEMVHRTRIKDVFTLAKYARQWTIGHHPSVNIDWSDSWNLPPIVHRGTIRG